MSKNKKMILGCSDARFITTKTGTHIIYYDVISGRQRRLNLSDITKHYRVYNVRQR